jgi:hypothetical protein
MNKDELRDNVKTLVGRWGNYNKVSDKAVVIETDEDMRVKIYTNDHCYSIYAKYPKSDANGADNGYLGCTVTTRKPLAGEDWNRGNDLADGGCGQETFNKIVWDILAYELVPIAPKVEPIADGLKAGDVVG